MNKIKSKNQLIIILLFLLCLIGCSKEGKSIDEMEEVEEMITMQITINNNSYTAKLYNHKTTQELIQLLPLKIKMSDLNHNEKYYYFQQPFSIDAKGVDKINSGDLMLYGDRCFVLFYESFSTNYNYTKIGYIENASDLKSVVRTEEIEMVLSKIE